jgi:hypothetical protein
MALRLTSCSPRRTALLPPSSPGISPEQFSASTATPGPHDFTVRFVRATSRTFHVHRIPPRVRDVRERPSCRVRRADSGTDLPDGLSGMFLRKGMDRLLVICPSCQSVACNSAVLHCSATNVNPLRLAKRPGNSLPKPPLSFPLKTVSIRNNY